MTVLDAANKLGKIIVGMNKALGDVPVTVKLRTGVKDGKNTAHKLMPRLNAEWGAAALTVRSSIRVPSYAMADVMVNVATRSHEAATIFQTRGLGLHQNVC